VGPVASFFTNCIDPPGLRFVLSILSFVGIVITTRSTFGSWASLSSIGKLSKVTSRKAVRWVSTSGCQENIKELAQKDIAQPTNDKKAV
jgi:hypothetical protein